MIIFRGDPRFWRLRIIELVQIRECQLRGEILADRVRRWNEKRDRIGPLVFRRRSPTGE